MCVHRYLKAVSTVVSFVWAKYGRRDHEDRVLGHLRELQKAMLVLVRCLYASVEDVVEFVSVVWAKYHETHRG